MNNKVIISAIGVIALLAAVGVGTYLVINRQNLFSQAAQEAGTNSSCPAPGTPATVTLTYPLCESAAGASEACQFDKAGCAWEAVSSASKYNVKVTEIETGANVASLAVNAPTIKTSFPVVQGRTYKCEVSAVSSCGSTGTSNEDTLLCETDAFVDSSPSPVPASPVAVAPPPVVVAPTPLPVATPPPVACGLSGCSATVPCENGYICVQTSVGQNYCAKSEYQSQCYRSPGNAACCQVPPVPPAPKPTLPPAGAMDTTLIIGGAGIGLVILGAAALLLL